MARKYGKQTPRIKYVPDYVYSDGADASSLFKCYRHPLDPWQEHVIKDWLGRDENDKLVATICGVSIPRQNGKNELLAVRELYGIVTTGEKILHTAQQVSTAREAFDRLVGFFRDGVHKELADMVETIRKGNGQEEIVLKNGGRVKFTSRSNTSNLGFSVDVVVYDEAQALTDEQFNTMKPTLSASPNDTRQEIFIGTPPTSSMHGEVFSRYRQQAIEQTNPHLAWHEWSVKKLPQKGTSVEELVKLAYDVNPAMGRRLTEDWTRQEALGMSLDGFANMRLGWWSDVGTVRAISEKMWQDTFINPEDIPQKGIDTYGVKFSADGVHVAIAACRKTQEKKCHIECIHSNTIGEGLNWIIDFFCDPNRKQKTAAIAIDGRNGTGVLANSLLQYYPKNALLLPATKGVIDAAVMFENALRDKEITHTNDKDGSQNELDRCALNAKKRPIGADGGWAYAGENPTPLDACTLALWASRNTKRNPNRKAVAW